LLFVITTFKWVAQQILQFEHNRSSQSIDSCYLVNLTSVKNGKS
jgi:hypothetical protein